MSWTNPTDVEVAWIGEGYPGNTETVQVWIDKAERHVRSQIKDIQARIDAEADEAPPRADLLADAIDVVVSMVLRVLRNPEGIRQTNVTTGPFTGSKTYGGDIPGGLALTSDETARLRGSGVSGAFTVSMIPTTSPFYAGA